MCLLAVLGSRGIVVKCTAAIFFRTVDYNCLYECVCAVLEHLRGSAFLSMNLAPTFSVTRMVPIFRHATLYVTRPKYNCSSTDFIYGGT